MVLTSRYCSEKGSSGVADGTGFSKIIREHCAFILKRRYSNGSLLVHCACVISEPGWLTLRALT